MKLSYLKLEHSSYDPAAGSAGFQKSRDEFSMAEGYELRWQDGMITVTHSGRTAVFAPSAVLYATRAPEPAAQQQPTREQFQAHHQSKGRR
jgi:hypothetical protein